MAVTAKEVQELRKISGAGMMECKSALAESAGDINKAFKLLREKGIAKAEKKSSREANEGLVGIKIFENKASIIEINSETDFVSRNSEFQTLANSILDISIKNIDDIDTTKNLSAELINEAVGKIGENIVLKRVSTLKGNIFSYVHNSINEGLGKIGVLLKFEDQAADLTEIGKNICMHIAAANPKSLTKDTLDKGIIDNEKEIIKNQLNESKKTEEILEKMMLGKLNKFYEDIVLMNQKYVIDPSISIENYISNESKKLETDINIREFVRFEVGS
jgi:elongation factor Ts